VTSSAAVLVRAVRGVGRRGLRNSADQDGSRVWPDHDDRETRA